MRIVFASGTVDGGSWRSTRELALALQERGHEVRCLVRGARGRHVYYVYKRTVNLRTKLGDDSVLSQAVSLLSRRLGARGIRAADTGVPVVEAAVIENALGRTLDRFNADVIVASSLERIAWRSIRHQAQRRGIASVLYMREASSTGHLTVSNAPPDLLIANAQTLADMAAALGYEAYVAPSVVDLENSRVSSSRNVALLINPIVSRGVDIGLALARRWPDIRFVLQESWPISAEEESHIRTAMAVLDNVEFRRATDKPAEVYRDARLLLAPHVEDQRPRVILEALANGIPTLVSDRPGLVDAARGAGVVVRSLNVENWADEFARAWTEPRYSELVEKAKSVAVIAADERKHALETVERALEEAVKRAAEPAESTHR